MNLNEFTNTGIHGIMKTAKRYYLKNRAGISFLTHMLLQIQKSSEIRNKYEQKGTHIPPFLIASIASQCNLYCAGCYARAGGACAQERREADLNTKEWQSIFTEAQQLGISFILLAGGEPLMRPDVIETAALFKNIIFPVFTNGTMMDEEHILLLDTNRNMIPVFSIEGDAAKTDVRRGSGVYAAVNEAMERLRAKGILFGASITVTKENLQTVTQPAFVADLRKRGCGIVFFVEYVPVSQGTEYLALDQGGMEALAESAAILKKSFKDMVILSFPGDEAAMGGCLASGRGFFHINASGGAEPCPFSPQSKYNLKTHSILEVLQSDYFAQLREIAKNADEHTGGCTLFNHQEQVLNL